MVRKAISSLSKNSYLHLFLGAVVFTTAVYEVSETIWTDLASGNLKVHHGVAALGLWHVLRALAEIVKSADYLDETVNPPKN